MKIWINKEIVGNTINSKSKGVFAMGIKKGKAILIGAVTGFANGLFGSGGGTIVVPCMERFLNVEEHKAHATAIAIILLKVGSRKLFSHKLIVPLLTPIFFASSSCPISFSVRKYFNRSANLFIHIFFSLL